MIDFDKLVRSAPPDVVVRVVRVLAAKDVDSVDMFVGAARQGDIALLSLILDAAEEPRQLVMATSADGETALLAAAAAGHLDIVQALLAHAPEEQIMAKTASKGKTPLMLASGAGHIQVVEALLSHAPNVQVVLVDDAATTALMFATIRGHLHIMRLLLRFQAVRQLTLASIGYSNLAVAALIGHPERVQLLLDAGFLKQQLSAGDHSPLACAAMRGHAAALQLLLSHVSDPAQLTAALHKITALELSEGHKECCRLLFARGADMSRLPAAQHQRLQAALRETLATALVPGALTQALNLAVTQLVHTVPKSGIKRPRSP